jgi:hypothetical protein
MTWRRENGNPAIRPAREELAVKLAPVRFKILRLTRANHRWRGELSASRCQIVKQVILVGPDKWAGNDRGAFNGRTSSKQCSDK